MPYRIEVSPNNRATCKNVECKDAAIKIMKGELRFATQVTIKEHTSWTYKHWGCVTPVQIANLQEDSGGDPEMIDGLDEIDDDDIKAKIMKALEDGHVADEDWRGDVEKNRPGQKGFRNKAPKKKKGDDDDAEEKPAPKKRGRKAADDDEAPAPKKARGKKAAAEHEDREGDEAEPKPKKARARKAAVKEVESDAEDAEEAQPEPKPKKARGKKAAAKKEESEVEEPSEAEAPKAKRGRKKAADTNADKPVPQKRGRKKKAVEEEE